MTLFIHAFGLVEDLKGQAELMVQPISTSQGQKETTISLGHVSNPSFEGGGATFALSLCLSLWSCGISTRARLRPIWVVLFGDH
jgi:hypothetical protein